MWKKVLKSIAKGCGLSVMRNRHAREVEARLARADEGEARLALRLRDCQARLERAERDLKLSLARAEGSERHLHDCQAKLQLAEGRCQDAAAQPEPAGRRPALAPRIADLAAGTRTAAPRPFELDADANVARARQLAAEGDEAAALRYYANALSLIHRYEPARQDLQQLSKRHFDEAVTLLTVGNYVEARARLVKAVEYDPTNRPARERLAEQVQAQKRWDLTKECYVYPDRKRGEQMYRESFLRALEYVAGGGVTGEVLEFGVLGGYTARIACETMRDMLILKQIHLFDSFDGLPEYTSPIDAESYEVAGRNVWADRMRIPDWLVTELGVPIEVHVLSSLSEVISPERVFIHRGYFEETLQKPLPFKAALIHIDCDLYQSTKEVFARLSAMDVLQDGCIILFDDYNCFKASPYAGERLAFREFLEGQGRFESTPFFTYGYNGAAFFLHEKQVNVQVRAA